MKTLTGKVIATKMEKTAVVLVEKIKIHPLYKKRLLRHKKYKVDTTEQAVEVGNIVRIVQTHPISKEKFFKVAKVLK